ncbi:MAG: hypothetical protein SNJ57_10210 [Cyanobacteriota bacterium]
MYVWDLETLGALVRVTLDTTDQNTSAAPRWYGLTKADLEIIADDMISVGGLYGRLMTPWQTTAADLDSYFKRSRLVKGQLVSGEIGVYNPNMPPGFVT